MARGDLRYLDELLDSHFEGRHTMDGTGFHAGAGWFFKRLDEGKVEVRAPAGTAIFDKDTWASIMASVSRRGEDGETFVAALDFHEGLSDA